MADRLWRAQVSIPLDSGIPEDQIVNTLYFDDDDDPIAGPEDTWTWILDKVTDFYQSIGGALFPSSCGTAATVRAYDMADPEPRVPLFTDTFSLPVDAVSPLPNEVALCASFAADVGSGDIVARRRGRLYLGPVKTTAANVVGSQSRPTTAAMTAVRDAMESLATPFLHPASPGYYLHWSIYSPTTHAAGPIGPAFNDVIRGWVDDAFDTQRRRGCKPTTRLTFAV